jgi:hypothetical protein
MGYYLWWWFFVVSRVVGDGIDGVSRLMSWLGSNLRTLGTLLEAVSDTNDSRVELAVIECEALNEFISKLNNRVSQGETCHYYQKLLLMVDRSRKKIFSPSFLKFSTIVLPNIFLSFIPLILNIHSPKTLHLIINR